MAVVVRTAGMQHRRTSKAHQRKMVTGKLLSPDVPRTFLGQAPDVPCSKNPTGPRKTGMTC